MGRKKGKDFKRHFWKGVPNRATEEGCVRIEEIWKERVAVVLGRTIKVVMMKSKGARECNGQESGAGTVSMFFFHQHYQQPSSEFSHETV